MRALLCLFLVSLTACLTYVDGPGLPDPDTREPWPWFVSSDQAATYLSGGDVLVLDARDDAARAAQPLPHTLSVSWQQFSREDAPFRGQLLTDLDQLARKISEAGVGSDRGVLVLGDPLGGWGEDGRIVWMLRALGHTQASIVDGGAPAFAALPEPTRALALQGPGTFIARPDPTWSTDRDALEALLGTPSTLTIDTRERREYDGETPYGEERGGHIPGAVHLYFKDFLDPQGRLRAEPELRAALEGQGITPDRTIVAYCTGGVRSAWFTAALLHLGYPDVRNYAGSMWEWSATGGELTDVAATP